MKYVLIPFLICLFVASHAHAQFYKWVDDDGNVHYTTTPPPEAGKHDRQIIGDQGQKKGVIRGRISDEEKAATARKEAEEAARKKAEAAARKRDKVLLISYQSVEDILTKRDAKLSYLDELIQVKEAERESAKNEYDTLLQEAIQLEREGKVPSEEMKANLRSAKREYISSREGLEKARADREKTLTTADADIKRFKELKNLK